MMSRVGLTICLVILVFFPILTSAADGPASGPASGMAIDFVAVNAEVTRLLFLFADYGGINIIVDGDVSGRVSVRLRHVPPEVALSVVLDLADLAAYEVDGSLFVTKKAR